MKNKVTKEFSFYSSWFNRVYMLIIYLVSPIISMILYPYWGIKPFSLYDLFMKVGFLTCFIIAIIHLPSLRKFRIIIYDNGMLAFYQGKRLLFIEHISQLKEIDTGDVEKGERIVVLKFIFNTQQIEFNYAVNYKPFIKADSLSEIFSFFHDKYKLQKRIYKSPNRLMKYKLSYANTEGKTRRKEDEQ